MIDLGRDATGRDETGSAEAGRNCGATSSGSDDAARLVAEASADSDTLAADGAAAAEHGGAALGLHAGTKAVGLHTLAAIGLKCALGHRNALLFLDEKSAPCGSL